MQLLVFHLVVIDSSTNTCLVCDWPKIIRLSDKLHSVGKVSHFELIVSIVTTEHAKQGKESYRGRGFSRGGRKQQR